MKTTVKLQEQLSYSKWPIFVILALIIICVIALVMPSIIGLLKAKKKQKPVQQIVIQQKSPLDISRIKSKYLGILYELEQNLTNGQVSTREAYQKMSLCIRNFVFDATGIEVTKYTLQDIKKINMPQLSELVEEYYAPEFAANSVGDELASLQKTKRMIELWN